MLKLLRFYILLFPLLLCLSESANAAVLRVTSLNDSGTGSLRGQVIASSPGDTIYFSVAGTISLTSGQISIPHDLHIIGPGYHQVTVDGLDIGNIFLNPALAGTLYVQGLHLTRANGNAIYCLDQVIVESCEIDFCNGAFGPAAYSDGGDIYISHSSLHDNTASNWGGAVFITNGAMFDISNTTIVSNQAVLGGGVYVNSSASGTIINSTIAYNLATAQGGGAGINGGGLLEIGNTIIASNSGGSAPNVGGSLDSWGNNLIDNINGISGGTWPQGSDLVNVAPNFDAAGPKDNGRRMVSLGLSNISPCIDAGSNALSFDFEDQRGAPRELDGTGLGTTIVDIGAVEYTPFCVTDPGGGITGSTLPLYLNTLHNFVPTYAPPFYICFDLGAGGPFLIQPLAAMAVMTNGETIIDGYSQEGSIPPGPTPGSLSIEVSGALVTGSASGFNFSTGSDFSVLKGICVNEWTAYGVRTNSCADIAIVGNFIGTDPSGTVSKPNAFGGISLEGGSADIEVGGVNDHERNVISGNNGVGISGAAGSFSLQIVNNYIGLNATGQFSLGNSTHGVWLNNCTDCTIGAADEGNFVAGNSGNGIFLSGGGGHSVQSNYVGLTVAGTIPANTNNFYGVSMSSGTANNVIGGTSAEGNIVSGNSSHGIYISGVGTGNVVENNFVGVDPSGLLARANSASGIEYVSGTDIVIGTVGRGNVVGANAGNGIGILGNGAIVQSNICGIGVDGFTDLGNNNGIYISGTANQIGGPSAGEGNWAAGNNSVGIKIAGSSNTIEGNICGISIDNATPLMNDYGIFVMGSTNNIFDNVCSGNFTAGIELAGGGAIQNIVQRNITGLDTTGTNAIPNSNYGIYVEAGAQSNLIGGSFTLGEGNLCSSNGVSGIHVAGNNTSSNDIKGNIVGLDITGTLLRPNNVGIEINQATGTAIGGTSIDFRNIVSGNTGDGILLNNAGDSTRVLGNYVGVDLIAAGPMPNGDDGIDVMNSSLTILIDGTAFANVIAGNAGAGISISADGVFVQGNLIGLNAGGTSIPNAVGIKILGGSSNLVGGTLAGEPNIIAYNTGDGVQITNVAANSNAILRNSIHNNGTHGIDLNDDGVSANDALDVDGGPNGTQNFPVLSEPSYCGTNILLSGALSSAANTTFNIDFYHIPAGQVDPSGYGEGNTYFGSVSVTTDGVGLAQFAASFPTIGVAGDYISAIATQDVFGSLLISSEFSASQIIRSTITALTVNPQDVSCNGGSDGYVPVSNVIGGVSPFTYLWNTGSTNDTLLNVGPGNYSVVVTDGNGCLFGSLPYAVNQPANPISVTITYTDESCNGACDGGVQILASGGSGAHQYGITGNSLSSSNVVGGLCGGTHSIQIADSAGCILDTVIMINPGITETANLTYSANNWCANDSNIVPITMGTSSGTFTSSPAGLVVNGSTGEINIASSAVGNYNVTYTTPFCGLINSFVLNINAADDASFNYSSDSFCVANGGLAANITGVAGGFFTSSMAINGGSGAPSVQPGLTPGQYVVYYTTTGVCPTTDSVTVTAITTPEANITNVPPSICHNSGTFTMTSLDPGGTWSGAAITDQLNGVFDPANATIGQNMVVYSIDFGWGCADSDTVFIEMFEAPSVILAGGGSYCAGDTPGTIDATFAGSGAFSTFDVFIDANYDLTETVSGNPTTFTPSSAGTVTVENVLDVNGCASNGSSNSVTLVIINPPSSVSVNYTDTLTCSSQNLPPLVATPSGGGTIIWYNDAALTIVAGTGNTFSPTVSTGINLFYLVEEVSGCNSGVVLITITVTEIVSPNATTLYQYCAGDELDPLVASANGGGQITWYDDIAHTTVLGTGQSFSLNQNMVGTHTFYVTETVGDCESGNVQVQVIVYNGQAIDAGGDFSICASDSVQLLGAGPGTFLWTPAATLSDPTSLTPFASPGTTTSYLLEVTIPFGCIFRDSVLVEVLDAEACGLHIYNAFSPDGDGINDTWSIGGIGQYPDNTVVVFNRWGDILSELQGYNNADVSWDGTSKDGLAVPAGTYYYSMKLTDELKYSGWVFINR